LERSAEIAWLVSLARISLESVRQKGYEVDSIEPLVAEAETFLDEGQEDEALAQICRIQAALRTPLQRSPDWPYEEPSELEAVLATHTRTSSPPAYDLSTYNHDVLSGWIGQIIGSALGLAVENLDAERIRTQIGEIHDYVEKPPQTCNDDTTFQILSLHTVEEYGLDFTSWDLALEWLQHMPAALTAEGVAISNLRRGLKPPKTAQEDNPFDEWVGGAMKAPIWGLLAPGRPDLAVSYAYRDAEIAHQANGLYGALYTAALVSLAFVERDLKTLLETALGYIPPKSRLAELIRRTFHWSRECDTWEQALARYHSKYELYHRAEYGYVHTFPCMAAVLIGFLYGEGEFERSIGIATMCGGDTDFPPALIGAVLGLWLGEQNIPEKWRQPIGNSFETIALGMECLTYADVARRICKQGLLILENAN
jgi:ADP-ribosylglycohydrolase